MSESRKGSVAEAGRDGPSRKESGGSLGRSRKASKADRKVSKSAPKALDLDDVLVNELGQFGRFQLYNILLVAFPIIASAFMSEYIFSAAAIPHRSVATNQSSSLFPRGYNPLYHNTDAKVA